MDSEIDRLLESVAKLENYQFKTRADQKRASIAARKVADKLQAPFDTQMEIWGSVMRDAAIKTCLDTKVFTKWNEGADLRKTDELAAQCGISKELLSVLLKHLAAYNIIEELDTDTYKPTPYSRILGGPDLGGAFAMLFECYHPAFIKAPDFFKSIGYVRPTSSTKTALGHAVGIEGNIFNYAQQNAGLAEGFDRAMRAYSTMVGDWIDVYPTERILEGASEEEVLVVDVGGNFGHDLKKFLRKHPESKDRLVLQDQSHVVEKAKEDCEGIVPMAHDFFTPNPVKGARVYLFHQILHDWPDHDCRGILEGVKSAMTPESRILIGDLVVPPKEASKHDTTYDLIMMAMLGGKERSEGDWKQLLESAGLRFVKVWRSAKVVNSILEVALP